MTLVVYAVSSGPAMLTVSYDTPASRLDSNGRQPAMGTTSRHDRRDMGTPRVQKSGEVSPRVSLTGVVSTSADVSPWPERMDSVG